MALRLTGRFNLLGHIAGKLRLKNSGVEEVRSDYIWHNISVIAVAQATGKERLSQGGKIWKTLSCQSISNKSNFFLINFKKHICVFEDIMRYSVATGM